MIDLAFKEWKIIKNKSIIIGDQETDRLLAKKSNIKFYEVNKNNDLNKIIKYLK